MSYNQRYADQHRFGCQMAARRPIRRFIRRVWERDDVQSSRMSVTIEILECGHFYVPSRDRRFTGTRTRRCEACYQEAHHG